LGAMNFQPRLDKVNLGPPSVPSTPGQINTPSALPPFDLSLPMAPATPQSNIIPDTPSMTADNGVDRNLHPSGIMPVLQNIVSTVSLGCPLDLKNIALKARNAEYNPKVM